MFLGNGAWDLKATEHAFGGDMFELNIYDRVLDQSEIQSLSADMCTTTESSLSESKILTWEDIMTAQRNGSVTDLLIDCRLETLRYQILQAQEPLEEKIDTTI